jgi:cytochrome c peroxidase
VPLHSLAQAVAASLGIACTPAPPSDAVPRAPVADATPTVRAAQAAFGRHAFYDRRLSADGETSCASCHAQAVAFADPRGVSLGADGAPLERQAPSLANVAHLRRLTWANPNLDRLETHALVPLFADAPVEMGNGDRQAALIALLRTDPTYVALARAAFPDASAAVGLHELGRALAAFQATIVSDQSPADGQVAPPLAARCTPCHTPPWYTDATDEPVPFHRIVDAPASDDTGLHQLTHRPEDRWRFRTPTLRNVALTAPYLHDGSAPTLDDAIAAHTAVPDVAALSAGERAALVDWLHTLTDHALLSNAALGDPWPTYGATQPSE